ncbi:MAG TPA: carbon starvation protein A, partial [Lachnospiraceae bacterium]|nr:carbon starvation protein A [Lachnospiraceae bacterium]
LIVTITSLCLTLKTNIINVFTGAEGMGWSIIRIVVGGLLIILAVILAVDGIKTLTKQEKKVKA